MRIAPFLAVAAAAAGSVVAAEAIPAAAASGGATVVLKDIAFNKMTTTIRRGQTVTWKWEDPYVAHTVTSTGKLRFKSASARQTGTYKLRFTKPGTYTYICTIHLGMKAKIVVR